jgi:hypothetical protein
MNHVQALKASLKDAVEEKLESTRKLRAFKAAPWAPEDVHTRAYEIARQRSVRVSQREAIRYQHLVYAYLRGRPYRQQEAKTREGNAPSARGISHYVECTIGQGLPPNAVEEWLQGAAAVIPVAEAAE